MPIEQMNISLPAEMARFIRDKVEAGQYTNASEVVQDALCRMQESEAAKNKRTRNNDLDVRLTPATQKSIRQGLLLGLQDLERLAEKKRKRLAASAKPSK